MKRFTAELLTFAIFLVMFAAAQEVSVDFDHHIDFGNYHTFSFISVQTPNSLWDRRVRDDVRDALLAKGFSQAPDGSGDMSIMAISTTHARPTLETFYTGFGGWHWRGFGDAVTSVHYYRVGTLVVDIYDTHTMRLIWRGWASGAMADKTNKNIKALQKAVNKMFKGFPPKIE
jgi:Domain of unknown function (DUF4136)